MARPANKQPTDGELEILRILWDAGPSEIGAVRAALLKDRDIAITTVATMLKIMMDKGLVTRAQGDKSWVWRAKVTRHNTKRGMIGKMLSSIFDGSASQLVTHLLEDGKLSADEREQIRQLLDQQKKDDKHSA